MNICGTITPERDRRDLDRVIEAADACAGVIRVASGFAKAGRRLDLAGLDDDVGRLCAAALDLAPEDGRIARRKLVDLLRAIDEMTNAGFAPRIPPAAARHDG